MDADGSNPPEISQEIVISNEGLIPAKKKKGGRTVGGGPSAVWDHFLKSGNNVKCKYCSFTSADKRPSNLAVHLRYSHHDAFVDFSKKTEEKKAAGSSSSKMGPSLESFGIFSNLKHPRPATKSQIYYYEESVHYKSLLNALSILFASNSLPYLLVENTEFKDLIALLDPKFKLPNRRKLAKEISSLYINLRQIIKREIKGAGKICLILDIWSRKGLSESYLGVLLRYFDRTSLKLKQVLIALEKMDGSHMAENINLTLQGVLARWDINSDEILYYVTDNGANIVKALKSCVMEFIPLVQVEESRCEEQGQQNNNEENVVVLEGDANLQAEAEDEETEILNSDDIHEADVDEDVQQFETLEDENNLVFGYSKRIPCIAHQLMCVTRKCVDGSNVLWPIIKFAYQVVKAFTKSGQNQEELRKLNKKRGLLSPSQTRWIYTYYVLKRLIESKEAVESVIVTNELDITIDLLKWKQLESIRDLLCPFAEFVNELEGDQYATINKVIPTLLTLIEKLSKVNRSFAGVDKVRKELVKEIENRFAAILDFSKCGFQPIHMIATFLDPDFLPGLSNGERDACINMIIRDITSQQQMQESEGVALNEEKHASALQQKYEGFFKRMPENTPISQDEYDKTKVLRMQLEGYVQEVLIGQSSSSSGSSDPVAFWVGKIQTFGEIAYFALNVLNVPASSASIERVFSLASIVQGGKRNRLSGESTEKELMIKVNKQYLI